MPPERNLFEHAPEAVSKLHREAKAAKRLKERKTWWNQKQMLDRIRDTKPAKP